MRIASERSVSTDERGHDRIVEPSPLATRERPAAPADAARAETVRTVRTSVFTPAALVAGVVAVVLLVLGGLTIVRAGLGGGLDVPVVLVAGFTATAILGLIELGFGLVLLAAALVRQVRTILFVGIVGGVAALVAVFQPSAGKGSLAIERGFAIWAALVMAGVVVAALMPTFRRSDTRRATNVG